MDKPATDTASSPSSCATSGGTLATLPQHASHDDRLHFLHEQSPRELVRAISSEYPATVPTKDIEQPRSTIDSASRSSHSSPSSSAFQQQNSSLSLASQHSSSDNFRNVNTESLIVPPEALVKPRTRARELSAPLPSVPPSTPASAASHRSSFSQSQSQNPSVSPSFLRHGSPVFSSPLTELSDSEEAEQDMADLSDSNSVEIISGYVVHPFVPGRYRNIENESQDVSLMSRSTCSSSLSPSSASSKSTGTTNFVTRQAADISLSTQVSLLNSQTPTPHPLSQSASPGRETNKESPMATDVSTIPFVPFDSKPATPSRAQPRPGANLENRLFSEISSPTRFPEPVAEEFKDDGQSFADITSSQDSGDGPRTPNVYINGLPPHFPDESLYLMTRDFGHVLSVRTFTRCVGEKMSGYGFVLFDSIESAERCIETLRKYRNLHPSFSKQIHKIPGTPYASGTITLPPSSSLPSLTSQSTLSSMASFPSMSSSLDPSGTLSSPVKKYNHRTEESVSTSGSDFSGKDFKDMSFREKMERLKDEKSTNLYMEGLPLTIDDVSLSALVSPHKVISSRFFQTKLSNPPRMIAFVRLDTRTGAEEIIERLHGRVVRGWNDNGCRISVRFADTHEQRELRRAERLNRGEEEMGSGAQLSMAHAALLNLRGAEVQAQLGNVLQHPHMLNYDHRPPVTISGSRISSAVVPAALVNGDSCFRLNGSQDVHHGYGGRLAIHHATQQYRHTPALPHHSSALSSDASIASSLNLLDSQVGVAERAAMMKRYALANMSGTPAGSFDAGQLAVLQQHNQIQQLQLLRQMQKAGIDPNIAIENHNFDQAYSLMPSVDIPTNSFIDPEPHVSMDSLPIHERTHGRKNSTSHTHHHAGQAYGKNSVSELPVSTQMLSPNSDQYHGQHGGSNHLSVHQLHQQKQQGRSESPTSPEFTYSLQFMRRGTDGREGATINSSRRTGAHEEGELTLISPALTYASRTPSTLSPATPLFNTFGTPAVAPATVPRGKTNVRERDYARLYKNEFRQ